MFIFTLKPVRGIIECNKYHCFTVSVRIRNDVSVRKRNASPARYLKLHKSQKLSSRALDYGKPKKNQKKWPRILLISHEERRAELIMIYRPGAAAAARTPTVFCRAPPKLDDNSTSRLFILIYRLTPCPSPSRVV